MKTTLHVLCLGLYLLTVPLTVRALDADGTRATLKGVTTVMVAIENLAKEYPPGLTQDQLRTDVELKLRQSGITVAAESSEALYVQVSSFKVTNTSGTYVYYIAVEFQQLVTLKRRPAVFAFVSTWDTHYFGIDDSAAGIRNMVADLINRFLNAYLSVNPRESFKATH
jgi:hypothetical protein